MNNADSIARLKEALEKAPRRSDYEKARLRTLADPSGGVDTQRVIAPKTATKGLESMAASRAAEREWNASKPLRSSEAKFSVHSTSADGHLTTRQISGYAIQNAAWTGAHYVVEGNIPISSIQMKMLHEEMLKNDKGWRERHDAWRKEGWNEGFIAGPNERN